jgi:hypothetical protein
MTDEKKGYAVETLGHAIRVVDAEGNDVALVGEVSIENAHTARLFAAAPELFSALDTFMRLGTMDDQSAIDAARAALAKARGEEV